MPSWHCYHEGDRGLESLALNFRGGRATDRIGGSQPRFVTLAGAADVGAERFSEIGHPGGRSIGGLKGERANALEVQLPVLDCLGEVGGSVFGVFAPGHVDGGCYGTQFITGHCGEKGGGDDCFGSFDFDVHLIMSFFSVVRVLLGSETFGGFKFYSHHTNTIAHSSKSSTSLCIFFKIFLGTSTMIECLQVDLR